MARWVAGLLASLLLALQGARGRDVDFCYAEERDPYLLFASKTAYEFVRSTQRAQDNLPNCTPLQIWWLNRHGTRYPGESTINKMMELPDLRDTIMQNHREGTGRLCDSDVEGLRAWRLRVTPAQANVLTGAGEEELFLAARRLRERYPQPFQRPYSASRYKFRHTQSQRTEMSARRFADGLFGTGAAVHIPPAVDPDMLLQPYPACPVWQEASRSKPAEWTALVEGGDVQALLRNVSARLGFRHQLSYDVVNTIYDMCRYEKAWNVTATSPWCAAFNKEELKIFEYAEDLKYYYRSGYGDDMNIKLACPLVKDMYEHFNALAEAIGGGGGGGGGGEGGGGGGEVEAQPSGVFYFAHSTALHTLQARLGLFRDAQPLRADNRAQLGGRRWRVSRMGSFAANLAALFYRCPSPSAPGGHSHHVLFLGEEEPLEVPGCRVGLCDWDHVQRWLRPVAEHCSLDWCNGPSAAALPAARRLLLLLAPLLPLVLGPTL